MRAAILSSMALDANRETVMPNDGLAQPATAPLLANSGASGPTSDAWLQTLNPRGWR